MYLGMIMHERRAFTLIVVLVVMAIIALLMGMLLPALTKAKEQTRAAICTSNMRQIGFGADFYAQDWPSRIPRGTDGRRVASERHKDGSNCLYLDWHVDWVAAEDMTVDMWRFHMAR
jgi:prepilin-type processing-associated H-X9-DG protein